MTSEVAGIPAPKPYFSDLHEIESAFLNAGGEFVVGEDNQRVVAMGGLKRIDGQRTELTRMRVHPDYQRLGYGSAILRHLEQRTLELGYDLICLDTLIVQLAARQFYLRHGYTVTRIGQKGEFEVVYFEKRLEYTHSEP